MEEMICLETPAFERLVKTVAQQLIEKQGIRNSKWVSKEDAMALLGVTSPTTLQRYRDERRIRFTQPDKKVILYDRESIEEFLSRNAIDPMP